MGFRQDECRPGLVHEHVALSLQQSCMSGALGRRAFSCGPPLLLFGVLLSTYPRVVKVSALCWLAALRGAGGAFGAEGSWLLQVSRKSGCTSVLPGVGAGSATQGEGRFFAHGAQVTISVFVCLATLFYRDLLGSGTASPTVGGQAGCNSNSINALGTPASNKVGVLASSAIFLEWHAHNLACSRRSKR